MPAKWKLVGFICIAQIIMTAYYSIKSLVSLFKFKDIFFLFQSVIFVLITWLSVLTINILNNNYPDKPIVAEQKRTFNWLFILNFLLISFLFSLVFDEYRGQRLMADMFKRSVYSMPLNSFIPLFVNITMLIFEFIILYSLYSLRKLIYRNFMNKQFEFENSNVSKKST